MRAQIQPYSRHTSSHPPDSATHPYNLIHHTFIHLHTPYIPIHHPSAAMTAPTKQLAVVEDAEMEPAEAEAAGEGMLMIDEEDVAAGPFRGVRRS